MDDAQRAALVAQHIDLPKRAAAIVWRRVRDHLELEELVSLGNLGLAEAAKRYDPASGASFRTFAWYRIQGAIVDGVRRNSTLPRRVWARVTALAATADYLEAANQRATAAHDQAGASTTADRLREVRAALSAIRTMHVVALDAVPDEHLASEGPTPTDRMALRDASHKLSAALAKLPERERALVVAHYVDGKTLLDAGAEMGLSKSWASRLHARAIDQLRTLLGDDSAP